MRTRSVVLVFGALVAASCGATAATFGNPTPIANPGTGTVGIASPYPSTIEVSGLTGEVTSVTVTLSNLTHTFAGDNDILLVSPNGQQVILMSDSGTAGVNGVTLTFDAAAATGLPSNGQVVSGTFLPTNHVGATDVFPAPAPAFADNTDLAVFNGPAANANGTWSLYATDDISADIGSIAGGWRLDIHTEAAEPETTCASEGYTGTQLTWCRNICEKGYTGTTLDMWIRRWMGRWHDLPYCTAEDGGEEEPPPQQE